MYFNSRPGRAIALLLVAFLLTACGGGASTPTNAAPVASRVTISGTVVLGSLLAGNYTYADAESDAQGSSTLRWMRSGNSGGTDKVAISGAITRNYTVVAADLGSYLYFCVLPVAISGTSPGIEVCSLATIAVPASANAMIVTVDEESVRKYIGEIEVETKMDKLETSLIKNVLSKKDKKELLASKVMEGALVSTKMSLDTAYSTFYNGGSIEVETSKGNGEDTDK